MRHEHNQTFLPFLVKIINTEYSKLSFSAIANQIDISLQRETDYSVNLGTKNITCFVN